MNQLSHWLDLSQVYGNQEEVAKRLRTFQVETKIEITSRQRQLQPFHDRKGF